jgi:putative glycerol-1-phosphate prenyltransferase
MSIYNKIKLVRSKQFAVLIDPDKYTQATLSSIARNASSSGVDFFLVGGSLLVRDQLDQCIRILKENCDLPVILFPGSVLQVNNMADAILLLSLISGRNADLLIGQHVIAAPYIKSSGIEVLSTGYMLIESGNNTTARYISNTQPIPNDKDDIATCTAMAGEMLGMKMIYMDAGSGAARPVPLSMIKAVRDNISIPLVVGGGIRSANDAIERCQAGADIIVVGNAIESSPELIQEIGTGIHST